MFVCADLLMHKDLSCGETGEKSHKVLVSLRRPDKIDVKTSNDYIAGNGSF